MIDLTTTAGFSDLRDRIDESVKDIGWRSAVYIHPNRKEMKILFYDDKFETTHVNNIPYSATEQASDEEIMRLVLDGIDGISEGISEGIK